MGNQISLDEVSDEFEKARALAETKRQELAEAESKLSDLDTLLSAMKRYQGISPVETQPADQSARTFKPLGSTGHRATKIKRIPSTRMVAELLSSSGEILTREEIRDRFEMAYGFPPSWKNPTNAINNAIARGIDIGIVVEYEGNRFGGTGNTSGY